MGKLYSVLVLDDNEVVLNMIKDMYASAGVHCDTSRNVGDMMEAMRTRSYDFMITDLKMPEMNGYEVLELMRSSSIGNSKEIPIIVATASGSCDEEDLLAHGFTACLFKPFSRNELLAVSEKCVSSGPRKENVPDFSSLLAYGGGCRLLDSLISETESDLKKLAQAEATDNREAIAAIAHHLRSSWVSSAPTVRYGFSTPCSTIRTVAAWRNSTQRYGKCWNRDGQSSSPQKEKGGSMARIIVIEDNVVYCTFICNLLAKEGFETEHAYHLSTARKLLMKMEEDDIVLADLRLPDGDSISW